MSTGFQILMSFATVYIIYIIVLAITGNYEIDVDDEAPRWQKKLAKNYWVKLFIGPIIITIGQIYHIIYYLTKTPGNE